MKKFVCFSRPRHASLPIASVEHFKLCLTLEEYCLAWRLAVESGNCVLSLSINVNA